MTMQRIITVDVTAAAIDTPIAMNATPFLGGKGRNVMFDVPKAPLTSVIEIQHAYKDAAGNMPAEGDAAWVTAATIDATSSLSGEFEVRDFVRTEVTTADVDGPDVDVVLKGVQ